MARPIEATPTLEGEDADKLLTSLEDTASSEEIERRRAKARAFLDAVKEGPVTTATTGVVSAVLIPKG